MPDSMWGQAEEVRSEQETGETEEAALKKRKQEEYQPKMGASAQKEKLVPSK